MMRLVGLGGVKVVVVEEVVVMVMINRRAFVWFYVCLYVLTFVINISNFFPTPSMCHAIISEAATSVI